MKVYVNQLGYLPESKKTAVIAGKETCGKIRVIDDKGRCVLEKSTYDFGLDEASQDYVYQADFSELKTEGRFHIEAEFKDLSCGVLTASSCTFNISGNIYKNLNQSLCKALYFQRCGMALEEKYAGIFHRECCHTGKAVRLEDYVNLMAGAPAAAETEIMAEVLNYVNLNEEKTSQKPGGHTLKKPLRLFDVRGGWHDAGDYGRYTTAAATALAHILYAWSLFTESFKESLNIPESGSNTDDILEECLYELRWLLKMQMDDGSVCHKLTSMRHANFVMPCMDKRQMILFPPSTMAAGAFAAVMALAARIYKETDTAFAAWALEASKKAWQWLEKHTEFIGFENPEGCNTGGYEDTCDADERLWAAAELYRATGDEHYLNKADVYLEKIANKTEMGWTDVAGLAGLALLEETLKKADVRPRQQDGKAAKALSGQFAALFSAAADKYVSVAGRCGYKAAMRTEDYGWGSNMVLLNRAMVLACAYMLGGEEKYKTCALSQMDYLLGVNAAGISYVTGAGENAFKNPHNRVTVADGIEETIPGFVSGGANGKPADEKAEWLIEPETPPMKCYLDVWECYSLNEITIYWNSPAIFLSAFLENIFMHR